MDRKYKLLVIDDDPFILSSIKRQLKEEPFDVMLINNPVDGLTMIDEDKYDLVLCDVKMEPLSGIDVLDNIKNNNPELPVIMLSGYVDDQLIEKAHKLGCEEFLIKPLRKKELIQIIAKTLQKKKKLSDF